MEKKLQKQKGQDWMTSQPAEMSNQKAELISLEMKTSSHQAAANQHTKMSSPAAEILSILKRGSLKHVPTVKENIMDLG